MKIRQPLIQLCLQAALLLSLPAVWRAQLKNPFRRKTNMPADAA